MTKLNKRQNADPDFRAASRARMKRNRANPTFNAACRRAIQRLNADPEFAAANQACMQRRNADPAFRAKQRAARAIPSATRAAIIAALKADPNATRVVRSVGGASYTTVLRVAKAEGIKLLKGGHRRCEIQEI
jgi:hypothetical protein